MNERMGPAGERIAYAATLAGSASTEHSCIVIRDSGDGHVTTMVAVVGSSSFAGTVVTLTEAEDRPGRPAGGRIEATVRLPTMTATHRLGRRQQFEVFPFLGVGYLDVAAYRHPDLRWSESSTDEPIWVGQDVGSDLRVEERLDRHGRLAVRRIRTGQHTRIVRYAYPEHRSVEIPLLMEAVDDSGNTTMICRRIGEPIRPSDDWLDGAGWWESEARDDRVAELDLTVAGGQER